MCAVVIGPGLARAEQLWPPDPGCRHACCDNDTGVQDADTHGVTMALRFRAQ